METKWMKDQLFRVCATSQEAKDLVSYMNAQAIAPTRFYTKRKDGRAVYVEAFYTKASEGSGWLSPPCFNDDGFWAR
jgi:hypothetical protein